MAIDKKLIDQLLTDYKKPEDIIGENGLLKELTKAILERALEAEMTDHLGYEKHDPAGHHRGNTRNGKSPKTLQGDFGELELETPRDRKATFDPKIERGFTIARSLQLQFPEITLQGFWAFPVARVAPVVARRVVLLIA